MVRWGLVSGVVTGRAARRGQPVARAAVHRRRRRHDLLVPVLLVAALGQPVAGVVFVLDGVLIGAGDGRYLAWAGLVVLVVYAPVALARGGARRRAGGSGWPSRASSWAPGWSCWSAARAATRGWSPVRRSGTPRVTCACGRSSPSRMGLVIVALHAAFGGYDALAGPARLAAGAARRTSTCRCDLEPRRDACSAWPRLAGGGQRRRCGSRASATPSTTSDPSLLWAVNLPQLGVRRRCSPMSLARRAADAEDTPRRRLAAGRRSSASWWPRCCRSWSVGAGVDALEVPAYVGATVRAADPDLAAVPLRRAAARGRAPPGARDEGRPSRRRNGPRRGCACGAVRRG